jgi:hypothetical protein
LLIANDDLRNGGSIARCQLLQGALLAMAVRLNICLDTVANLQPRAQLSGF